jgi:Skp family chaperone for outer membrane proteins
MTQDEIIEMARTSGFMPAHNKRVQHFAKLVAAKEREACAKICDKLQDDIATEPKHCAESIRARGKA